MGTLVWILPLLMCPLGMALMGAVVWVGAKLRVRSPEPAEESARTGEQLARSVTAPERA
jgi:hypothetical protein